MAPRVHKWMQLNNTDYIEYMFNTMKSCSSMILSHHFVFSVSFSGPWLKLGHWPQDSTSLDQAGHPTRSTDFFSQDLVVTASKGDNFIDNQLLCQTLKLPEQQQQQQQQQRQPRQREQEQEQLQRQQQRQQGANDAAELPTDASAAKNHQAPCQSLKDWMYNSGRTGPRTRDQILLQEKKKRILTDCSTKNLSHSVTPSESYDHCRLCLLHLILQSSWPWKKARFCCWLVLTDLNIFNFSIGWQWKISDTATEDWSFDHHPPGAILSKYLGVAMEVGTCIFCYGNTSNTNSSTLPSSGGKIVACWDRFLGESICAFARSREVQQKVNFTGCFTQRTW